MAWLELKRDDGDIAITPPSIYAVTAIVKSSHTKADLVAAAKSYGLEIISYIETLTDKNGYRVIDTTVKATAAGKLPWGVPWPLSLADDSHIARVWVSADAKVSPSTLSPPATYSSQSVEVKKMPFIIAGLITATLVGAFLATR